jgi:membrane protein
MLKQIKFFLTDGVWKININELDFIKAAAVKFVRILILAVKDFAEDHCQLRASALTFYTVFSIVPIAALIFGIAKGFGLEGTLKAQLCHYLAEYPGLVDKVYAHAETMLREAKGGMVAGIGVIFLFWTVMKVIGNIEMSFNYIWGIKTGRSFWRKISDYMLMVGACPILIIASGSATVLLSSRLSSFIDNHVSFLRGVSNPAILKLLPLMTAWLLFSFIYAFMPNTKVKWKSAVIAGIISGTVYQVVQEGYIFLQVMLFTKYNTIYGGLAVLPLFLVWLQLSWLIVLFGAEISFAHQNLESYEYEPHALDISYKLKKQLTVQVAMMIVKAYQQELKPPADIELAHQSGIPVRQVRDILFHLLDSKVIAKNGDSISGEAGYLPAIPSEKLTIQYVLEKTENCGKCEFPPPDTDEFRRLAASFKSLEDTVRQSPDNKLLKEI